MPKQTSGEMRSENEAVRPPTSRFRLGTDVLSLTLGTDTLLRSA
jgi:hypothetical protein